jgi:hypothetical protein
MMGPRYQPCFPDTGHGTYAFPAKKHPRMRWKDVGLFYFLRALHPSFAWLVDGWMGWLGGGFGGKETRMFHDRYPENTPGTLNPSPFIW